MEAVSDSVISLTAGPISQIGLSFISPGYELLKLVKTCDLDVIGVWCFWFFTRLNHQISG